VLATFAGLKEDASHRILDLAPAVEANLRLYGRYARWVRFGGFSHTLPKGGSWAQAIQGLPPIQGVQYDIVMVWDVLDRLPPDERPHLIQRLVELTGPGARLYILVDGSGTPRRYPLRFSLQGLGHVSTEVVGPAYPAPPPLLPAQVGRVLTPFQVAHAFTLRGGGREYVAHWQGSDPRATTWWTR